MEPINYKIKHTPHGFTLVEILVVLAIAVVLLGVTLSGYSSVRAGNRRTNCQANLVQVYQAIRLYSDDHDGRVPYYDPDSNLTEGKGIGLWALYAFPDSSDPSKIAPEGVKPEGTYVRNPKVLHCPSDADNDQMLSASKEYNMEYLSYQQQDNLEYEYNPIRTTDTNDADWQRQLLHYDNSFSPPEFVKRAPTNDTIVLWCMHHRTGMGGSAQDIVLFWDGTLQVLPKDQTDCPTPTCAGWRRVERSIPQ